jgi:uncharacterized protein involved in outer membrane biogenesis
MKRYLMIAMAVFVAVFAAGFVKDIIVKAGIEKGVDLVTGLKINIGGLNVGILNPVVDIKNIKLRNPSNFPDKTMIDMPEIYVKYDLGAIIGGKVHLPELRLALKEFVVVKNAKGELNLDALRTVQAQKEGTQPSEKTPGKAPEIKIDSLKLSIGKVIYKDYSRGGEPSVKEFDINLNESYTNVNDPYKLASLIVVKALMNTSIAGLTNFDLKGLQGTVGKETFANAQKMASEATATLRNTAAEAAKKAEDAVKDVFKNPFGSGK